MVGSPLARRVLPGYGSAREQERDEGAERAARERRPERQAGAGGGRAARVRVGGGAVRGGARAAVRRQRDRKSVV